MKTAQKNQSGQPRSCIAILGVPFDSVTMEDTVGLVEEMVTSRRPHYLATADVDFTVQALEDEELRRILFDAHLVVCDGTPLLWASHWLGHRLPERVAGSDLVPILLSLAARQSYRVYFLGGRQDITKRAIENVRRNYRGLNVVGWESPAPVPLHEMDHEKITARIREAKPDLLFVSFDCPKQEKWIAMHYRTLGVPVCVGIGATIDCLAGEKRGAPQWMQRVKDFWIFGLALFRQWKLMRPGKEVKKNPAPAVSSGLETSRLILPERLDAEFVARSGAFWDSFGNAGQTLLADASAVTFVDSTGMGALIRLRKLLRENDAELVLIGASAALTRGLEMMKLTKIFAMVTDWDQARVWSAQQTAVHQQRSAGNKTRMDWSGDVTAETVDEVWDRTAVLLNTKAHEEAEMAIDLNQVTFLDSAGLGFMVRVRRMGRQHGVVVKFINPSEAVQRVVRMAKLEEFLLGEAA